MKTKQKKKSKFSLRFNQGKLPWALVHFKSLIPLVRVLEVGAAKYAPNNWKTGFTKEKLWESLYRHVIALQEEEYDEDTKVHHIGGVMANALFYSFHFVKDVIKPNTNWSKHLKKIEKKYKNGKPDEL